MDLRLIKEMLTNKENQFNQMEKNLQQQNLDLNNDGDTLTLCENDQQPNVQPLARQLEQKTSSLADHNRSKFKSSDQTMHYATARTIINGQQEDIDEEESTWPNNYNNKHQFKVAGLKNLFVMVSDY